MCSASQSGGVVLAEVLALLGPDDRLVENLEDVVLDAGPVEPGDPASEVPDELLAARGLCDPVEEVGLHDAGDLDLGEVLPGEKALRARLFARLPDVEPDHDVGDQLRHDDEVCVLQEEVVVVLECRTEGGGQQAGPKHPLDLHLGALAALRVKRGQRLAVKGERSRPGAESAPDLQRARLDVLTRGDDALDPDLQRVHVGIGRAHP